jgi:hypothetical protein
MVEVQASSQLAAIQEKEDEKEYYDNQLLLLVTRFQVVQVWCAGSHHLNQFYCHAV